MSARRFARENGLGLFFGALFLLSLAGQAVAGYHDFNSDQLEHHSHPVSFGRYLTSSAFGSAVMENWQSEYLQFALFVLATIWLLQRGSPESKELGREGRESEADQRLGPHAHPHSPRWARRSGGAVRWLYSNSLLTVMATVWLGSWFAQSVTAHALHNAESIDHHSAPISYGAYLGSADFWERSLQNWQSEFLAVGSFAVLAVYLRQRGSPESKPVGAAHDSTGAQG